MANRFIDNFDKVRGHLVFDTEDDFYHIQVIQRRKEIDSLTSNNRVLRQYIIHNISQFDHIKSDIVDICNKYNARAYINPNRKSLKKATLETLKTVSERIYSDQYIGAQNDFYSSVGKIGTNYKKLWIVDIDVKSMDTIKEITTFISQIEPNVGTDKVEYMLETKNGYHLITNPFNLQSFKEVYPLIEVHKNNPTILYCLAD